jgi:hypothetical protein
MALTHLACGPGWRGLPSRPPKPSHASLVHGRLDVGPSLGECPQNVLWDVGELAEPVAPDLPAKAERCQLSPEGGLVEGAGGLLPGVQVAAVGGRPPTICTLDQVGNDDMSVELGIPGPAGPMAEGGADEAMCLQQLVSPGSSSHEARLRRQLVEHGADGPVVGVRDSVPGVLRSECPTGVRRPSVRRR